MTDKDCMQFLTNMRRRIEHNPDYVFYEGRFNHLVTVLQELIVKLSFSEFPDSHSRFLIGDRIEHIRTLLEKSDFYCSAPHEDAYNDETGYRVYDADFVNLLITHAFYLLKVKEIIEKNE